MAIGMPADTEIAFVEELAKGMQACAEFCGTAIIGGDLDTHAELTVTGTALGRVRKSQLLLRQWSKTRRPCLCYRVYRLCRSRS